MNDASETRGAPRLRSETPIPLEVKPGSTLGSPASLAVSSADGSFFVADSYGKRVYRFARSGEMIAAYGTPGHHDYEIRTPAALFVIDAALGLADVSNHVVHLYDTKTGAQTGQVPLPGYSGLYFPSESDGLLWIASTFRGRERSDPSGIYLYDALRHVADTVPLPEEYFDFPSFKVWSGASVVQISDTLLLAPTALSALLVLDRTSGVLDTVMVPAVRRRILTRRIAEADAIDYVALSNAASQLAAAALSQDGRYVLLVHYNIDWPKTGPVRGTPFLTIVRRSLRAACVDGRVPLELFEVPRVQVFRDTLFFVGYDRAEEQPHLRVYPFTVDTSECNWVPMKRTHYLVEP